MEIKKVTNLAVYAKRRRDNQLTREEERKHQRRKNIDMLMRSNRPIHFKK